MHVHEPLERLVKFRVRRCAKSANRAYFDIPSEDTLGHFKSIRILLEWKI